ncbi:hypothetical protein ARALYDRAFT_898648 [Arabidopsis lyrata subsp. lyrata]|uniref:Uncharacterized protein n=1 Tax=Arabidopsis lyrata subsp. lyrata TaxID=81972 RepID=D7L0Y3_ARALL|nr:hypothetical protein ARALYDRAFT_898648 [Arabidopsis lyrata subsp. lyrata]
MNHTSRKRRPDLSLSRTDYLSSEMLAPTKSPALNRIRIRNLFLLLLFVYVVILLLFSFSPLRRAQFPSLARSLAISPTRRRHLLFSIASSHDSWLRRSSYVCLWYSPKSTRAFVFLDRGGFESDLRNWVSSGKQSLSSSET